MKGIFSSLDIGLERLARAIVRYPKQTLVAVLCAVAILVSGMGFLYLDVTNESLFNDDDPTLQQYEAFQAQFGRDDAVVAAIRSSELFTPGFLQQLEAYHRDLEKSVPYLDLVTSLVSVTSVTDRNGDMQIGELVEEWPQDPADYPAFAKRVSENPLYRNILVSADGAETLVIVRASAFATEQDQPVSFGESMAGFHDRLRAFLEGGAATDKGKEDPFTSFDLDKLPAESGSTAAAGDVQQAFAKPLTTRQMTMFVDAVREVTARHAGAEFPVRLAGGEMIDAEHKDSIHADFAALIPLVFLLAFVILYLVLRRVALVMIALLVVVLSLLATFGLMGWAGSPITPVAVALPPLLLTVGIGDAVHMISVYLARLKESNQAEAVVNAVRRTGVAVLFTSLTTAAGFTSFTLANIKSIAHFGLFAAFGVMVALVLSLTLVPALLCLTRASAAGSGFSAVWRLLSSRLLKLTDFSLRRPGAVLVVSLLLIALMVPGVMKLRFSHDVLTWFEENRPVRVNTLAIDKAFNGVIPLEIVLDTGRSNGIYDPDFMARVQQLQEYAESLHNEQIRTGRATSVLDTLKRIHLVLNNGQPASAIPESDKLIAQELLLFESSGASDVEKLIDSQFSKVRVTVRFSWGDALDYLPLREQLVDRAEELFNGKATVVATGSLDLVTRALVNVIQSMSTSYMFAAVVIFLMMAVLLRNIFLAGVAMIPNIAPIVVVLGLMGYADIPITLFTALLGGIALGVAVDDTVHYMHGFRHHYMEERRSLIDSIRSTVLGIGPALLFTTLAISIGFYVFLLSTNVALFQFGLLLGITVVLALVMDVMLTPALLKLVYQRRGSDLPLNSTVAQR